jgi:hypothetical protein
MMKNTLTLLLALLLTNLLYVSAAVRAPKQDMTPEQAKGKIARAGTGEKAKVTVWTKDGKKTKGYIAQAGESDFVLRDRNTDAPTTIAYSDVTKVDLNRGHSTLRNTLIGVGIGVGALLLVIGITIARLD